MGKILKAVVAVGAILLLFARCGDTACLDNRSSTPVVALYASGTSTAISIDSISVYGVGQVSGTPLVDSVATLSSFDMPLPIITTDAETDTVSYVIAYNFVDSLYAPYYNDTITFVYSCYPFFDSAECGAMYNYEIVDYSYTTHSFLDYMEVVQTTVNNVDAEHIRLYYEVEDEE